MATRHCAAIHISSPAKSVLPAFPKAACVPDQSSCSLTGAIALTRLSMLQGGPRLARQPEQKAGDSALPTGRVLRPACGAAAARPGRRHAGAACMATGLANSFVHSAL